MATTTTEEKKTEIVDVRVKMRLATSKDFNKEICIINRSGQLESKKIPKYGQPYWLKSQIDGSFENRNYQITPEMDKDDWTEFKDYLRRKMVYVPLSYFELLELKQ